MAYVSQEHKAEIKAALKTIIPATWKWSLSVENHSTIVLTVRSADVHTYKAEGKHIKASHHELQRYFNGSDLRLMTKVADALNLGNFDKSDIESDYFNVGHYTNVRFKCA